MLVYCFGSFILQDIFLSLQEFAFKGQNMTFTVNVLFTCIIYCDAGPGYDWNCLQVHAADKFFSRVSYLPSYVFLRRLRSVSFRELYACLEKFLCFLQVSDQAKFLELGAQGSFSFDSFRTTGFEFNS